MIYLIILCIVIGILCFFHGKGVPVFLYHQVNPISNTTPADFEKHLIYIKKNKMKT